MKKRNQKQPSSRMIMWSDLPSDVEESILSRLPVKSLLGFRWVCKHWFNLFTNNPHFIKLQLHNRSSTQINECPKLVLAYRGELYYVDIIKAWENQCFTTSRGHENIQIKLDLPFLSSISKSTIYLRVSGSCNGLLCLSTFDNLYLLNPDTKKVKCLPKPQNLYFPDFAVIGFGYNPRTNEYKVMIIDEVCDDHCDDDVYVYTLGTNSSWRSIGGTQYKINYPRYHALVNGALHWIASGNSRFSRVPISFDFGDEKFRELSLPKSFSQEDITSSDHSIMGLVELGGLLSLYHRKDDENFDIWVMKDYGDERSWTKVFSAALPNLSRIQESFRPLYILKKDEVVFCESCHGFFILDVVKKQIRKLQLRHTSYDLGTVMHMESLVSLRAIGQMDRGNNQERREKEGGRSAVEARGD